MILQTDDVETSMSLTRPICACIDNDIRETKVFVVSLVLCTIIIVFIIYMSQ